MMLYILAVHIIFVVTWFAGLFYMVRLFVYHSETNEKPEPDRSVLVRHFKIAERRLWYGITWPSLIGTYIFGIWLTIGLYGANIPGWFRLKILFVAGLTIYHLMCGRIFRKFQKDDISYTSIQMRMWNEVATVFLIAIVFIVVLKDLTNWIYGVIGLVVFSMVLLVVIRKYKKLREEEKD